MYLLGVRIQGIRAINHLQWNLPDPARPAGWHVVVGDNGSGKSSFLKAIGLALVGPKAANALRQPWEKWLNQGRDSGLIHLSLSADPRLDRFSGSGRVKKSASLTAVVRLDREEDGGLVTVEGREADRHVWGKGEGWFSAAYGPFRRFRGGDPEYKKVFYSLPRLGRHLSLFDESVALSECLEWLQELRFKQLEDDPDGRLLRPITRFVNQPGFLPFAARLERVTSSSVEFVDGNGARVDVESLSDGYRSILSMTFELIRQMAAAYGPEAVFDPADPEKVAVPGVVLVDEIDAHLHPTWQRRVGAWFREHFPKVQFIVTTHSPIICQAADPGSVYRLPRPGTAERGRFVTGQELRRLIYGSIEEAYGTEVFGDGITRSAASRGLLDELARLNVKEVQEGLDAADRKRQQELRATLPTTAYATPNGK